MKELLKNIITFAATETIRFIINELFNKEDWRQNINTEGGDVDDTSAYTCCNVQKVITDTIKWKEVKTMGLFTDAIEWLEDLAEEVLDEILGNDDWCTSQNNKIHFWYGKENRYE